jgi:hypothetical protein
VIDASEHCVRFDFECQEEVQKPLQLIVFSETKREEASGALI